MAFPLFCQKKKKLHFFASVLSNIFSPSSPGQPTNLPFSTKAKDVLFFFFPSFLSGWAPLHVYISFSCGEGKGEGSSADTFLISLKLNLDGKAMDVPSFQWWSRKDPSPPFPLKAIIHARKRNGGKRKWNSMHVVEKRGKWFGILVQAAHIRSKMFLTFVSLCCTCWNIWESNCSGERPFA